MCQMSCNTIQILNLKSKGIQHKKNIWDKVNHSTGMNHIYLYIIHIIIVS